MHSWLLCCILITHPGSVCTFTSLPPGIFSLVVNLDIPLLSAVLPTSAPLGTVCSDPLNAVVNAGCRLQEKELKLPGKTGLLGVQICSAWFLHIFNMVLNGSSHKISKELGTWIYLSGSRIAVVHCRYILWQQGNK